MLADDIPQPIQWHEGMLLVPQHFQQSCWRQEMLVQYNSLLAAPYCWGVRRLALDSKLLPTGTLRVLDLEAVMPDGTIVTHRPSDNNELLVDVASDATLSKSGDIAIHLALPARSAPGVKGGLARYEAVDGAPVADENTGEGEVRIPVLRPRLSLLAGDTPPPKYESMPIARIHFTDEAFALTDYIPPTAIVPAHSPLGQMCSAVTRIVRAKAMYVSEQVRAPSAAADVPLLMENRSQLQSLVAGLPALEAALSMGTAHPASVYLALCALAGHLAGLGTSMLPPVFSAYDHKDLRATFQEVINFAIRMTNEGIPENYTGYPFRLKDRVFSLMFDPDWAGRRTVLGLRASPGVSEKEIITWGDECLIGSESVINSMRDKRIRGATRQFLAADDELTPVRGVILFNMRPDPEFVRPGETLQVLNFGERGRHTYPMELVLFVKRSS